MRLNDEGAKAPFDAAMPGFRREYVAWLEEVKTETTRLRRMGQAIEWIAEGKGRLEVREVLMILRHVM